MRAAVRFTTKIERRLKKIEREFTRPIPKLRGLNRGNQHDIEIKKADFKALAQRISVRSEAAINDNISRVRQTGDLLIKKPAVALCGAEIRSSASKKIAFVLSSVVAQWRQKTQRIRSARPSPTKVNRKNAPGKTNAAKLAALGVITFLASFAVVFHVAFRLV